MRAPGPWGTIPPMSIRLSRRCHLPFSVLLPMLALLGLLASCGSSVEPPPAADSPPRHLVLVSLDTFRADHLRPELTPRLAALADESVRFDDFVTAAPSTLASHTSLFTGLYPHHHGVASNGWMVPQDLETLAEVLGDAGFRSAGFVGSFALLDRFDIDQGFDHWDQRFDQTVGVDAVDQNQRRADRVVDAALRYLDSSDPDAPAPAGSDRLFLFVHLFDAHYPYDPPDGSESFEGFGPAEGDWTEAERAKALEVDGEGVEELARRYAQEVAFVDRQAGRLLDELARRGILDDALVVVTSDHGEALWQHGERWHATEVYRPTTHGVFFVRLPSGQPARVSGVVGTVDVMPTILGALGVAQAAQTAQADGEALDLSNVGSRVGTGRPRFSQATGSHLAAAELPPADPQVGWPNARFARAIRHGRWKLIQWPLTGREALFDVAADPSERRDLLSESETPPPEAAVDMMRRRLEEWAASADPLPSHFDREFELDTRRALCALGYVECPDEP